MGVSGCEASKTVADQCWRRDRVAVSRQSTILSSYILRSHILSPHVLASSRPHVLATHCPAEMVNVTVRVPGATGAVAVALSV